MSAPGTPRAVVVRAGPRPVRAILCMLLFGAAVWGIVEEASRRRRIAEVAAKGDLARRHPEILATAGILEDADAAALIVAEQLLEDSPVPRPTAATSAEAVRALILDVSGRRPASAYARMLVGRSVPSGGTAALWKRPLELASSAAAGFDPAAVALARRYLDSWNALSADDHPRGEAAIRRAFLDDSFLAVALPTVVERLGPDTAVRLLPDDPRSLLASSRILGAAGGGRASELVAARLKALALRSSERPRAPAR